MNELPRRAVSRTARLASLPLGFAGRTAVGFGKRVGGKPAEAGRGRAAGPHRRAAVQGARRAQGRRDEVRPGHVGHGGRPPRGDGRPLPRHADQAAGGRPAAARRHGAQGARRGAGPAVADREVPVVRRHARPRRPRSGRCTRRSGATVARSRSRSSTPAPARPCCPTSTSSPGCARLAGGWIPGMDIKPITDELKSRMSEELDYNLEAANQRTFAKAFRDDPHFAVPDVLVNSEHVIVSEWMDGIPLSQIVASGTPEQRNAASERYMAFLLVGPARAGLLHADPHPGNFRLLRRRAARGHRLRRGQPPADRPAARDGHAGQRGAAVRGGRAGEGPAVRGVHQAVDVARRRGAAGVPRARSSSPCRTPSSPSAGRGCGAWPRTSTTSGDPSSSSA